MRNVILLIVFFVAGCMATAQENAMADDETAFSKLMQTHVATKENITKLNQLSKQYTLKPGEKAADLDKAWQLATKAKTWSQSLHDKAGFNESLLALSLVHIEKGNSRPAFQLMEEAHDTTKIKILFNLNSYYHFGGQITRSDDSSIFCLQRAVVIAASRGYADLEILAREILYNRYCDVKQWNGARKELLALLPFRNRKKPEEVVYYYYVLGIIAHNLGEIEQMLRYALEGLQYGEKNNAKDVARMYELLGAGYVLMGQHTKGIDMYEKAVSTYLAQRRTMKIWAMRDRIAQAYAKLGQYEKAVSIILQTEKETGCPELNDKITFNRGLAQHYDGMGQTELAGKYYGQLVELLRSQPEDAVSFSFAGGFFVKTGQYDKGREYLTKALQSTGRVTVEIQASIYRYLYRADSATGNYQSALAHYIKNRELVDSLRKVDRTKEMQRLMVQYETEKKDRELKLQEQNILLLSRQRRLQLQDLENARLQLDYETKAKQQGIQLARAEAAEKDKSLQLKTQDLELLQKETLLKESKVSQAHITRNITIVGAGLLLVILLLVFYQYRLKRQMNIALEGKNLALGRLLKEKEVLLKEVHHRVKNNLHTIISLLETQSAFLTDDALAAIQNSQHRVYAMSLIHQKLYQVDNSTTVSMANYLPELICYLKDSFTSGRQINFHTQIDDIGLDVSQAIPIGLILNEAITNAIKYAFPGNRAGEVTISMTQGRDRQVCLTVADNGIGLPVGWQSGTGGSLGLKLMQGLSGDIQGNFNIETLNGTKATVRFKRETFGNGTRKNVL